MKKGFTLVELLAVISIIALIGLVSIVGVTKLVNNSKRQLYQDQKAMIISAAKIWAAENIDNLDYCTYLTVGDLKTYGLLDDNIIDPRTNTKMSDLTKVKISLVYNEQGMISKYSYEIIESNKNITGVCTYIYGKSTLIEGETFNRLIKNYINQEETNLDTLIKSIVFLTSGYPDYDTYSEINYGSDTVDLSVNRDESILGYFDGSTLYIVADDSGTKIQANAISDKMFYGLTALESISFGGLDTRNVVSMESMFENCYSLRRLDLSEFTTAGTLRMNRMFKKCSSLQELDLSSFTFSRVTSSNGTASEMFDDVNPDLNVTVSSEAENFITTALTNSNVDVNLTIK